MAGWSPFPGSEGGTSPSPATAVDEAAFTRSLADFRTIRTHPTTAQAENKNHWMA
jgi:hypothetical protein